MSRMPGSTESLVIGGGPVGLYAALSLQHRGVSVQVLDAGGEKPVRGYACALHPGTLECFDRIGLLPMIFEESHRVDRLTLHHGAARGATAAFERLHGGFPYALTLRQTELERILETTLEQRGTNVIHLQEVTRIERQDGFVRVTSRAKRPAHRESLAEPSEEFMGAPIVDDVDFVIGADGYFSACRRALGVELVDYKPCKAFAVFEFLADLSGCEREAHIVLGDGCVSAFWPLGKNLGRWTFEVWENLDAAPTLEMLRGLLGERATWFAPNPEQLCWGAVAPFEHRVARRFGSGRIWLAGDAAHSTSPIGFQSMNRGFREADALSALVASALFDEDHRRGSFDLFEQSQQEEWLRLFGVRVPPGDELRAAELARSLPATGAEFRMLSAQLGMRLE